MKTRILLGILMIAAVGGVLLLDWWLEAGLIAPGGLVIAAGLVGIWIAAFVELDHLASSSSVRLLRISGLTGMVALTALPFWAQFAVCGAVHRVLLPPVLAMLVLGGTLLCVFAEQMIRHRTEAAMVRVSCTLGAVVYLGIGGAMILWIRMEGGVESLVLLLAAVKFTDIGAYFVGSAIGKHKLIPWVSPGKSWEGFTGGVLTAAAVSMLVVWALGIEWINLCQAAVFGVLVGLAGQFGDLCESLLKRSAGAKDSGGAVPQFGGVLDIIDSPLLGAPVGAVVLVLMA